MSDTSNNKGMEEGEWMLSFNSQSFQLFNVFRSLSLSPFSLYISKFPFYIQRHYRKAFNSSHNVLCIWILTEEMETFFLLAATFLSLTSKKNFGLALLSLKSVSKKFIFASSAWWNGFLLWVIVLPWRNGYALGIKIFLKIG